MQQTELGGSWCWLYQEAAYIHDNQKYWLIITRQWDSNELHVNSLSQVVFSIYNIDEGSNQYSN